MLYNYIVVSFVPLAQSAEHLTFNQGVWGSNPQWHTIGAAAAAKSLSFSGGCIYTT